MVDNAYTFTPVSLNGKALTGAPFLQCYWDEGDPSPYTEPSGEDPVQVTIPGKASAYVRGQKKASTWLLTVELSSTLESDLQSMLGVFNGEDGEVYLRCTDGQAAPATWRVRVRVLKHIRASANAFKIALSVADPTWEQDAVTTDSQLNKQTSPVNVAVTNAGNRRARPVFTFTADAAKALGLDDYEFALEGVLVNRAPGRLRFAYLMDQVGAASRLATDTSATGATVKQTTGATTVTVNIAAGAGTITLTSAAGWPSAGLGWITDSRGAGFHDQFYYTSIAGAVLQGVVWLKAAANGGSSNPGGAVQTGGGIAHTMAQVTAIQPSGVMLSGDDARVVIDDSEVDRWLVNWNAAASDIVVNVDLPEGLALTLAAAMTAASPANGGIVAFNEDIGVIDPVGFFVVDNEVFHYTGRDVASRTVTGVYRALWGSTAAVHAAAAAAWFNPKHVILCAGWAKAAPPPCPSSRRPAVQLPGSSNQTLKWGDEADDPSTIFYDPAAPDRTGQWLPEQATDDSLSNSTVLVQTDTQIVFQDSKAGSVKAVSPANSLAYRFAQRIATQAAELTYDAQLDPALALDLYGTVQGTEMLLKELIGSDAAMVGRQIDNVTPITGKVRFEAKHAVVTGAETGDYAFVTATDTIPLAETFTLSALTTITRLAVRLKRNGASDAKIDLCAVNSDTAKTIDTTKKQMVTVTIANANIPVAAGWVFVDLSASPLVLPAGTYGIIVTAASTGGKVDVSRSNGSVYGGGEARIGVLTNVTQTIEADWDGWSDGTTVTSATSPNRVWNPNIASVYRFPLSSVPAAAITGASLLVTTQAPPIQGGQVYLGPYVASGATDYGQSDPSVDNAATLLAKANQWQGTHRYALGTIAGVAGTLNTINLVYSTSAPWVNPIPDLQAAAAGGRFSLGVTWVQGEAFAGASYAASIEDGTYAHPRLQLNLYETLKQAFGTALPYDIGFRVYGSPLGADSISGTAGQTKIGKYAAVLDAAARAYMHRMGGFASGLLHLKGTLTNGATGDTIAVDKWMRPNGATLAIDCAARTVIYTEDGVAYPVERCITPSNTADWMAMPPGANAIAWAEPSLLAPGQIDLVTTWRGVKS